MRQGCELVRRLQEEHSKANGDSLKMETSTGALPLQDLQVRFAALIAAVGTGILAPAGSSTRSCPGLARSLAPVGLGNGKGEDEGDGGGEGDKGEAEANGQGSLASAKRPP